MYRILFLLFLTSSDILSLNIKKSTIKRPYESDKYKPIPDPEPDGKICQLPIEILEEIQSYQPIADKIIDIILNGTWKHKVYTEMGIFVDKFGPRPVGYKSLDDSIDYMVEKMTADLGDSGKVSTEDVEATGWIMGESSAKLLEPFVKEIKTYSIGGNGETSEEGIEAEIVVARNFEELAEFGDQVFGKLVVFNNEFHNYSYARQFRINGIYESIHLGAVGCLVKSVTPFSLHTLHHGHIPEGFYPENITKIPAVSITPEDAQYLQRIYDLSIKNVENRPRVHLRVRGDTYPNVTTKNIIGELTGSEKPHEIVIVSGHIDSVNVGDGSVDDANGVMISVGAVKLLKEFNLIPKRSLQAILWTAEENGLIGAQSFVQNHKSDMGKYIAAFESDIGTFKPIGLDFAGSDDASCIVQEILKLSRALGTEKFRRYELGWVSSDISLLQHEGVPGLDVNTENNDYFWYHHSEADRFNVIDPDELDLCLALWTISSYVISDLSIPLPRNSSNWVKDPNNSSSTVIRGDLRIFILTIISLTISFLYPFDKL